MKMQISYNDLFADSTKELFVGIWEAIFKLEGEVEMNRQQLMRDPNFDIKKAFKMITHDGQGDSISREELGEMLGLDRPHRDILFARFKRNN